MTFRKKQTIEAVQVTEAWFEAGFTAPTGITLDPSTKLAAMGEGNKLTAKVGDWIILGAKVYPMHDEQFKALYEPVEAEVGFIHVVVPGEKPQEPGVLTSTDGPPATLNLATGKLTEVSLVTGVDGTAIACGPVEAK